MKLNQNFPNSICALSVTVAMVLLTACSSSAAGVPVVGSATQTVNVSDPALQMHAATLQIPVGWHFAGTIGRDTGCHAGGPNIKFTAQSPDGSSSILQLTGVRWDWTSSRTMERIMYQLNCAPIDLESAAGFLVNVVVPAIHEKATIVGIEPVDAEWKAKLANEQEQKNQQLQQMARAYGQQAGKVIVEAARVRVQFQRGGRPMEEMVSTRITCTDSITPGTMMESPSHSRICTSGAIIVARAPQGQLDALVHSGPFVNLGKTAKVDAEWENRLVQEQRSEFQTQQAAQAAAYRTIMANGDAAGKRRLADAQAYLQNEKHSYAQHNALVANNRAVVSEGSHQISLYAADRGDFVNPATGQQVEASGLYNHQWMSSDSEHLIQTNEHTYDPNGQTSLNETWTELVPK